jgi:hypothetical protein
MKKALIMGSEVVDTHEIGFEVHPSMFWVDCNDDVQPGDRYINGNIEKLIPPPIEYNEARAAEYPALRDQLDAIWKGGEAEVEMRAKILEVKAKYPKP